MRRGLRQRWSRLAPLARGLAALVFVALTACDGPHRSRFSLHVPYMVDAARWIVLDADEKQVGCLTYQVWSAVSGADGVGFGVFLDGPAGCDVDVRVDLDVAGAVAASGKVVYRGGTKRWAYLPVTTDNLEHFVAGRHRGQVRVRFEGSVSATESYPAVHHSRPGPLLWEPGRSRLPELATLVGPLGVSLPCGEAVYVQTVGVIEVTDGCDARISFDDGPFLGPTQPSGPARWWVTLRSGEPVRSIRVESAGTTVAWRLGLLAPVWVKREDVLVP